MRFRDALAPRLAVQTFDCWLALRVDGKVPKKDLLCPLGLPPAALPFIMLMEWMGEAVEFRCRLVGDGVRKWYGTNVVGLSMRDLIPPEAHAQRAPLLRHCLSEGAPAWFSGPMLVNKQPVRHAGRLMLPVSYRSETPDGIVMVVFIDEAAHTRPSIALDETRTCSRAELG